MKQKIYIIIVLLAVGIGLGATFYSQDQAEASAEGAGGPPPAMPVQVTVMESQMVQVWRNFSGKVVAVNRAEIRPQVSGRINEIRFEDGQMVEKGDVLIVIDPRPYEASLTQAQAALGVAETQAILAEKEYQRAKKLIRTDAISQSVLDERTNNRESANAAVLGAKALLESAQINLDYAFVKSPISGKVSRAEITEGNLVQTGAGAPLLTSVVAQDRVYVDFEVDEQTYILSAKNSAMNGDSKIPVRIQLLNQDQEYKGFVHSFDNRIDPTSGTIRARAIFDNKDKVLLPGMTVSILMGSAGDEERILVSERAIGTDQDRKFVYTVNGDSMAKYREIKVGQSINGKRVVLSGLKTGEKVITEGIVRIRPNMPVSPQIKTADTISPKEIQTSSGEEE